MVTLEFAEDGSCVCMYVCTVCTSNGRVLQSTQLEYIKHEGIYLGTLVTLQHLAAVTVFTYM